VTKNSRDNNTTEKTSSLSANLLNSITVLATVFACLIAVVVAVWGLREPEQVRQVVRVVAGETPIPVVETVIITATPHKDTSTPVPTETPEFVATVRAAIEATQAAEPKLDLAATVQAGISATLEAQPTATSTPTPTLTFTPIPMPDIPSTVIAAVEATQEALPTSTPIIELVTATLEPTPTEPANTPPGTILEVGQTWSQGELELTLDEITLHTIGITFRFYLTSHKLQDIIISHHIKDNFSLVDNRGVSLPLEYTNLNTRVSRKFSEPITLLVKPEETVFIGGDVLPIFARFDIANEAITEVIMTVTDISDITEAKWRVPIYR